jgi:hypothetical protein
MPWAFPLQIAWKHILFPLLGLRRLSHHFCGNNKNSNIHPIVIKGPHYLIMLDIRKNKQPLESESI